MNILGFDNSVFIVFFAITFPFIIYQFVIIWRFEILREIPSVLEEFPIFRTSPYEYIQCANKIAEFVKSLELKNGKIVKLSLTENEINHLCNRGLTKDKYKSAYFNYYTIGNDFIIEKHLSYPWLSKSGCKVYTRRIRFIINNSKIQEEVIAVRGIMTAKLDSEEKNIDRVKINYLNKSVLLPLIFSYAGIIYDKGIFDRFKKISIKRRKLTIEVV